MEAVMENGRGSSFTVNGQFFALLSVDGRLRIWDTASGKLIQQLSPGLHVESSCTCLCWTKEERGKVKKKRKPGEDETLNSKYPSLIIGTTKGKLLAYNPVSGELDDFPVNGHNDTVNDIKYCTETDTVYSCSNDKYIIEWPYKEKEIKWKWKGNKSCVKRICVGPSGKTLLSAGQSIKLWDLETKVLLQRFHGHTSFVSLLQFSPFRLSLGKDATADNGYYFLSASHKDCIINAWQINSARPEKSCIASYMLSSVPVFMDTLLVENDNKPLKLCAGCEDGRIHFFECTMNGKTSRPIESTKTLDYLQKESKKSQVTPALLINARLVAQNGVSLMLVMGSLLKPSFKKFIYSELEETSKIVEERSTNFLLSEKQEVDSSVTELASQTKRVKVISDSGYITPTVNNISSLRNRSNITLDVNCNEEDRSQTGSSEEMVSMEERLRGASAEQDFKLKLKPTSSIPNADSFSQLLIQGLHSSDNVLLSEILFKTYKESVLRNTIKRIPSELVCPLLSVIVDKLHRNPARSKDLSQWLKIILAVHLTYLLTTDSWSTTLSTLYRLLKAQEDVRPKLINLQGKIDLLLGHAHNVKSAADDNKDGEYVGTMVFNEDSEDEMEKPKSDIEDDPLADIVNSQEGENGSDESDGECGEEDVVMETEHDSSSDSD